MTRMILILLTIFLSSSVFADLCKKDEKASGPALTPGKVISGYWCGPGYMGRNSCWMDELDRVCRDHDLCEYANVKSGKAAHSCACDLAFIKAASAQGVTGKFYAMIIRQRNTRDCLKGL